MLSETFAINPSLFLFSFSSWVFAVVRWERKPEHASLRLIVINLDSVGWGVKYFNVHASHFRKRLDRQGVWESRFNDANMAEFCCFLERVYDKGESPKFGELFVGISKFNHSSSKITMLPQRAGSFIWIVLRYVLFYSHHRPRIRTSKWACHWEADQIFIFEQKPW